jgi:hypothetical protein
MASDIGTLAAATTASQYQCDIAADSVGLATESGGNLDTIAAGYAADDAALGSGILIQGDDGTNRKNINVDATTGDVQVDVTNTVSVSGTVTANAGTGNFDNSAISGSEILIAGGATQTNDVKVTLDSEAVVLGAGSAGIGKLTANTGVDIGDVDVLTCGTITPGTGATNLGKAVDTAAESTDTGVAVLAVRDDEKAALTPVDGDYVNLRTDRFGHLHVTQLPDATSEVKFAVIDDATSGNNTIITAAGAGIKIRVLAVFLVAAGDVLARFESGADGTALTGQMDLTTNSGFTLPFCPVGWFETADNTLLNLELDGAVSCDGCVVYVEV